MYTSSVKITRLTASLHRLFSRFSYMVKKERNGAKKYLKKFKGQRRLPGFSLERGKRMLKGTHQK